MGKTTLLFQWVIVIAISQLHAVPVRDRGGIIYGTEFLKILDPRTRLPLTENEAESPPSTSSLPSEPTLRASAALETSASSTISSASSSSSSSSVRSRVLPTARQKSRALNTLPLVSSSNDLKSIIKYGTKTTPSDTSAIQRTKSQPSTATTKDKSTTNNTSSVSLSHDKNGTESVLDYDYYYYYMDDLSLQEDPKNSSAIKEAGTLPSSLSSTPQNVESHLSSFKDITTPFTVVQATTAEPQKARQTTTKAIETTTSTTSKPAIARTTRTTDTPTTTVPTRIRSAKSTTVRPAANPPVSRPPFRYQTEVAPESTTTTSTAAADQPSTQEITLELDDTVTPAEPKGESDDTKPRNAQTTTETTSSGNNVRSDTRKLVASIEKLGTDNTSATDRTTSQTINSRRCSVINN
ncbi:uncharacterized protein LOC135211844 [Macrobrachium nipponense]|uniref:uncharacterized protein LOC135211844 n=1 Tax=Macrobrachium nipponense TaxID=159736 RepID=UPI0030C7A2BD